MHFPSIYNVDSKSKSLNYNKVQFNSLNYNILKASNKRRFELDNKYMTSI